MNTPALVSYTFTVSVDDTSVLPKIKSALKCFKGVVSVRSSNKRSAASCKTLDAIRELETGDYRQFDSFDDFVTAMNHEIYD